MKKISVSVIIPCYNAEAYLQRCLDSVVNQTFRDIEIICINDGSTDGTYGLLQQYALKDPRLIILDQENKNAGNARNRGLEIARGEYLSFLDSDDFFEETMLEQMVVSADLHQVDFVVCHSDQYCAETGTFLPVDWTVRDQMLPATMPFSHRQLNGSIFRVFVGWAWDKLYRRSFIEKHGLRFQEQRTTNDLFFVHSASALAEKIAVIPGVYVHQRVNLRNSLSVTREKSWHCFYDALTALRHQLIRSNLYQNLERDYIDYALNFSLWNLNSLAEPSYTLLRKRLKEEWFRELGITGKPGSYFYDPFDYWEYFCIMHDTPRSIYQIIRLFLKVRMKIRRKKSSFTNQLRTSQE